MIGSNRVLQNISFVIPRLIKSNRTLTLSVCCDRYNLDITFLSSQRRFCSRELTPSESPCLELEFGHKSHSNHFQGRGTVPNTPLLASHRIRGHSLSSSFIHECQCLGICCRKLKSEGPFLKQNCLEFICRLFGSFCTYFVSLSSLHTPAVHSIHSYLYVRMCDTYGEQLAICLRQSALPLVVISNSNVQSLPESPIFPGSYDEQLSKISPFSLEELESILWNIPSIFRPPNSGRSCKSKALCSYLRCLLILHYKCDT